MNTDTVNGAMVRSVPWADRLAISISAICIAHCLLMPLLFVALPSLGSLVIDSEALHLWLVYAVIPSSLFALGMGCKQHRRGLFIVMGLFGLGFLMLGIAIETVDLNSVWEKMFTVFGALLIAFAHICNFQRCRDSTDCACQ